jgi:hypothetical protein
MIFAGYIAGPQKTILQPLGNPFRILLVGLATRHILEVLRICQNYRELSLENNENDSYAGESNPFPDTGNALFRLKKSGARRVISPCSGCRGCCSLSTSHLLDIGKKA